jgi:hypothetical protein
MRRFCFSLLQFLLAPANMPGVPWGMTRTGALAMMEQRASLEGVAAMPNRYCLCAEIEGHVVGTVHLMGDAGPLTTGH